MILQKIITLAKSITSARFMPICLIAFYFIFLTLFVSLSGNFPLNDDWSYGEGVRNFLTTGKLIMPTVCAAGFTHVFLGALFCKIFGFSYVILRASVFIVGFIGSLAFYGALREIGIQRHAATFCTLLYAGNPLLVNLYFGFMSDVTALSLLNIYLYVLLRAVRKDSLALALCSVLLFIAAVGARQSVIIFIPCTLALLSIKTQKRALLYSIFAASIIVPIASYIVMDQWLIHRGPGMQDYLNTRQAHLQFTQNAISTPLSCLYQLIVALGHSACYLSLFIAPLLLSFIIQSKNIIAKYWRSIWFNVCLCAGMLLISAKELVITQGKLMPFNPNLLRIPMVCALTIMGLNMPLLPPRRMMWLTILSFFLSWILLVAITSLIPYLLHVYSKFKQSKSISPKRLAIISIVAAALFISLSFIVVETLVRCIDRYYLIALAPLILGLAMLCRWLRIKVVQPVSIVALTFIVFYASCAAQDYMSWNRARWLELERLEAKGIPSWQIDGGYEYNTLRDIKIYYSGNHGSPPRDHWRWWPIKGEKYIISFSTIPDYKVIDRISYWSALTFSPLEVLVLESENGK